MPEGGQAVQHCQWLASLGDNAGVLDLICFEVSVAISIFCEFIAGLACGYVSSDPATLDNAANRDRDWVESADCSALRSQWWVT